MQNQTSRERLKSAQYLRLKNSNRTSKGQVFFYSTRKTQKLNRIGGAKGGTLSDFSTSIVAKHQKIEGGHFGNFFRKRSHNAKKTERGDHLGFFNIHSALSIKNFFRKSHNAETKLKGVTF